MDGKVLVFEPDLLFSSRIESAAAKSGLNAKVAVTMDELERTLQESVPEALLVNLDAFPRSGASLVGRIQGKCMLIGYYSHVNAGVAAQALADGFEQVMPRRTFIDKLDEIFADLTSS